ncbi:MAG TPA: hypothetical protein VG713_16900 [Pirellulales bacterium]|nr:hypothetical protein [Pirellulales bacterium]
MYQCPGEPYAIDRAVHLGRLATFYSKCRECPHRHDTGLLSEATIAQLSEVWSANGGFGARFTAEGVEGVYRNQITVADVRRVASAFGQCARTWQQRTSHVSEPSVALAGDDRPLVPELIAAAAEGLRWAGCRVIDIGSASSPCAAWSLAALPADAGMLIGNASGQTHQVVVRLWAGAAAPLSEPGRLSTLRKAMLLDTGRPTRTYGPVERRSLESEYLATLADHFHALRPLRVVIDTTCRAVTRYLRQLAARVACDLHFLQDRVDQPSPPSPAPHQAAGVSRLSAIARAVCERNAHFGIWIDGDGEACQVVDERGQKVSTETLVALIGQPLQHESAANREAMYALMAQSHAPIAGGDGGRIWFGDPVPMPDALRALAMLLTALSRSDQLLSEAAAAFSA